MLPKLPDPNDKPDPPFLQQLGTTLLNSIVSVIALAAGGALVGAVVGFFIAGTLGAIIGAIAGLAAVAIGFAAYASDPF